MDIRRIIISFLLSAATTVILLFLLSALGAAADISDRTAQRAVFAVTVLSVLIWSFLSSRGIQKGGFIHGGAEGALYALCFSALSFLYTRAAPSPAHIISVAAAAVAAGALGGIIGINSGK